MRFPPCLSSSLLVLLSVSIVDAAVLCATRTGTLKIRDACRDRETLVPIESLAPALAAVSLQDNGMVVRFTGVNVQIVSGSGATEGPVNGVGNLIVGYNEPSAGDVHGEPRPDAIQTGSHNLVVGRAHTFLSYGGLVTGIDNAVQAPYAVVAGGRTSSATASGASVFGGECNTAAALGATVIGGGGPVVGGGDEWDCRDGNTAVAPYALGAGGLRNSARGEYAVVAGGSVNVATGNWATVIGGGANEAEGDESSVFGGHENNASGHIASILGGLLNQAQGPDSTIAGGERNLTTGSSRMGALLGGLQNTTTGYAATVTGGEVNVAAGNNSAVSGGNGRLATGLDDWVAGGLFQDQ